MKEMIVPMCMTLDGFIAGPKGELDWIFKESDDIGFWFSCCFGERHSIV